MKGAEHPRPAVLVVDDDDGVRECLTVFLEAAYEVRTAASGPEALGLVAERPPDVMLLDLRMPGMDGVEVLRRLRDARTDFPVIVLTAEASVRTAVAAIKLGAHDYLAKLSMDVELQPALRDALASRPPAPPAVAPDELVVWHAGAHLGRRAVLGAFVSGVTGIRVAPPGTVVFDADRDAGAVRSAVAAAHPRLQAAVGALGAITLAVMGFMVRAYRSATVEAVAHEMSVSRRHLLRRFGDETGMSLKEYFGRVRTEAAKCLLLETPRPIEAVGEEAGFFDASHFARVFRQYTNTSPGAYRRVMSQTSRFSSDSYIA